ncbi:MAG: hypothetical protein M1826_000888 [Phylliscum demangeonii]|nr:MAG: hypothetical protein M1826_000888 [Phylliscum demangeonii]
MATATYDRASGQVFRESTWAMAAQRRISWEDWDDWAAAAPCHAPDHHLHGRRAASLFDMALRAHVPSASRLTADVVRGVPATVATAMWNEVKRYRRDSFRIWKAFAAGCPGALTHADRHRRAYTDVPAPALDVYTVPATPAAAAGEWVTILVISMPTLTRAEAVGLARFPSLVALRINDSRPANTDTDPGTGTGTGTDAVQDSVVRAWSSRVAADGAFARLCSLCLCGWAGISQRSLQYLSAFPVLTVFNADRTSIRAEEGLVVPSGWEAQLYRADDTPESASRAFEERFLYSPYDAPLTGSPSADTPPVFALGLGRAGWKGPGDSDRDVIFRRTALPATEPPPPSPSRHGPDRRPDRGRRRRQPAPSKMRSLVEVMDQCVDHAG